MANYISSYVIDYNDSKQLKYGVINLCDNTTYYGSTTWSVIDNGGIIGLTVDGSTHDGVVLSSNDDKYLVITNTYTGKNADPVIIVKASSDLVSCDSNNTCTITLKRACYMQPVMFEVKINDDSKGYATSITGNVNLHFGVITDNGSLGIGFGGKLEINSATNSTNDYITDSPINIPSNCNLNNTNGKGIYFHFNDTTLNISLNNNVQNVSVSGEAKYKFDGATYTALDSISSESYTYTSTSNSITITGCDYTTTKLNGLMDGLKTLYIKHIINLKYDDEVQYAWYISTDNGSTWSKSSAYSITITVNNNFSGGEFVRVAYCTENMDDCVDSYTIRNGNNFTLSKIWELSDLNSSGNNCAVFSTNSTLTNDLKNSNEGTYHISGDIVSSLGDNFPINVYYKVTKKEYIIIFKKNDLTIESVESKPMPKIYTFDVYYKESNSSTEQSASGIIMSVSSSSTYYTPTFKFTSNTVTLAQNISDGDIIPDDIEFDVKVCIKPSDASSNICNSLPVHFINKSPIVSEKISVTIKWSISCSNNLMLYQNNTSIDVDLNNEVNSSNTSGSITKEYISSKTSTNISIKFSMKGAGYSGNNNYNGKKVITAISCNSIMDPSSKSGTYTGCCLGKTGAYVMFTNGGINCTSTFNNVAISDGDTIFIDINLGIGV